MQRLCSSCATPLAQLQPFSLRNCGELSKSDQGFYLETKTFGQILRTVRTVRTVRTAWSNLILIGGLSWIIMEYHPISGNC